MQSVGDNLSTIMHIKISIALLFLTLEIATGSPVFIGGIFDDNPEDEAAFRYAIDNIIVGADENSLLSPLVSNIESGGPFKALQAGCSFLKENTIGIFGPKNVDNINTVQSLCDDKEIPHITGRWCGETFTDSNVVNLFPHSAMLSKAYLDVIVKLNWKSFTVLYEDNESLLRVSDLIREAKTSSFIVTVKQIDPDGTGIYRTAFKKARASGEKNFVIDCRSEILEEVLLQAQQIGLMTDDFSFFITSLDLHSIDLGFIQYSQVNMTGIRLINPDHEIVTKTIEALAEKTGNADYILKTETALLIDGVGLLGEALKELPSVFKSVSALNQVNCETTNSYLFGTTLLNFIRGTKYAGLTGTIQFDTQGFRSNFELEVISLHEEGIAKIGTWNTTTGVSASYPREDSEYDEFSLRNKTLIVITCLTDPYGMLKETTASLYGNDRFEGFGIDLFEELSNLEGFNYTFIIREDKKNGAWDNATQQWTGMIGDLISEKADLAITDLTITSERAAAVDFTAPFMTLGISILFRKPEKAPPSFFSFADPFAIDTWMGLAMAYVITSVSMFIMGRLSADEWNNPYPCIEEPEFLVNQFSGQNSIWFTIGSLMQQGTEIAPIGISTRMVAGMWWFFCLIMVSSYTANLAAFLATENPIMLFTDINSLVENAEQYHLRYGAKANGATASFFKDSQNPVYQKIAQHMQDHPEDMMTENKHGVKLAEDSLYAFFMESTSIEYETQRHCSLQQYGKELDEKFYGVAMRKGYKYRNKLHTAMLKLQSSGVLDKLKRKWWEERRGGGQCEGTSEGGEAEPLGFQNVEGVFYVTVVGILCSAVSVTMEMVFATLGISRRLKIPLREAFRTEMKSYMQFGSNVKQVMTSKSESKSKSKSKSESPKDANDKNSDDNVKVPAAAAAVDVEPYGFISAVSKERLTNSS